jgi:hypothetical protein
MANVKTIDPVSKVKEIIKKGKFKVTDCTIRTVYKSVTVQTDNPAIVFYLAEATGTNEVQLTPQLSIKIAANNL